MTCHHGDLSACGQHHAHYRCCHAISIRISNRLQGRCWLQDVQAGLANTQVIPAGGKAAQINACVVNVEAQMAADRKTTALKQLQGLIWTGGYRSGDIRGELFADVPDALQQMRDQGIKTYIYSSGSRRAQRDLFGHTQVALCRLRLRMALFCLATYLLFKHRFAELHRLHVHVVCMFSACASKM